VNTEDFEKESEYDHEAALEMQK